MDSNPLLHLMRTSRRETWVAWYMQKALIAQAMLRTPGAPQAPAEEVVHETLVRIADGRAGYEALDHDTLETVDGYFLRCMKRTIGSYAAQRQATTRRAKHDRDIRLVHGQDERGHAPSQQAALEAQQAQNLLNERLAASGAGKKLRQHGANAGRYAALGYSNQEIAAETGWSVKTVDKNRSRLFNLLGRRGSNEGSSK